MPLTDDERRHFKAFPGRQCHCVLTGDLLEITYLNHETEYRSPGKRGQVNGFTPGARLRMMRTVAMIDWSNIGKSLFITVTYPDACARRSMKERNRDRYVFLCSLEKYLGRQVGALWRMEWKSRKTGELQGIVCPHVHMIIFDVAFIPWQEIRGWWGQALGVEGPLATDVRQITGGKVVGKYVTKYCAKPGASCSLDSTTYLNNFGRHWGIHRRDVVPWSPRFLLSHLTADEIRLVENAACMTFRFFTRGASQGFSIFGDNGGKVGEIILNNRVDAGVGFD